MPLVLPPIFKWTMSSFLRLLEGSEFEIKSSFSFKSDDDEDEGDDQSTMPSISLSQLINESSSDSEEYESELDINRAATTGPRSVPILTEEPRYPVQIGTRKGRVYGDTCQKGPFREWFHCLECNDNNFDICLRCERRGRWCFNQEHHLYRLINKRTVGMISRQHYRATQELAVCSQEGGIKRLFSSSRRITTDFSTSRLPQSTQTTSWLFGL
ncbi:hypothetical protein B0T17DRAFT_379927 [Bombardia bombarda]|uniref:Uncharacterized protein n=1 Tax=Bombardia bombarda TaxID=252184 RepID=A0AA40BVH0_9PEZI|nr:hypothetical protein B0T17DRAFT_379927 [Bombardia bombarda]